MKRFNKQILEAVSRGIQLAIDDYQDIEDNNSISHYNDIIDSEDIIQQKVNLKNHPYLAKGKKLFFKLQDLHDEATEIFNLDWRDWYTFKKSAKYFKFMLDNFVDCILWKYPEFRFDKITEKDIMMGINHDQPSKEITIWYTYKGHSIAFEINIWFEYPQIKLFVDGKNITIQIYDKLNTYIGSVIGDKNYIKNFKDFLNSLDYKS